MNLEKMQDRIEELENDNADLREQIGWLRQVLTATEEAKTSYLDKLHETAQIFGAAPPGVAGALEVAAKVEELMWADWPLTMGLSGRKFR